MNAPTRPTLAVAVVMDRETHPNRWEDWRHSVADVVIDEGGFGTGPTVLRDDGQRLSTLHPGFRIELFRDEGEGYYLNLSSGAPAWFVVWRADDEDPSRAWPETVSVSYNEAGRWLDAQEHVEQLPMPATAPPAAPAEGVAPPPLPTMDDVAALTRESDYARFVMPGVDDGVKSAAMKKLFSDPHFNVMDGLDTYIDDYNKPDPIPLAMLRQMNQSKLLRLFDDDEKRGGEPDDNRPTEPMNGVAQAPPSAVTAPELIADDHDADLQLQPDDAAGRPGPGEGSGA